LLIEIEKDIRFYPDTDIDNTVEIQLPFIKYLFPESRILWLRASPSDAAIELGRAIHSAALRLNRKVVVVGSTDLTHYGPSYGFMPHGVGEAAVKWVKEVNDRRLIDAILTLNPKEAIKLALKEYSACSAGGVAAALSFAMSSQDKIEAKLLEYANSSDVYPTSSFVGYAGIIFSKEK
jgi:AmmeMemoRadiSam system protein B